MSHYGPSWAWDLNRPEAIEARRQIAEFRIRNATETLERSLILAIHAHMEARSEMKYEDISPTLIALAKKFQLASEDKLIT
jgi:hypothetical protein